MVEVNLNLVNRGNNSATIRILAFPRDSNRRARGNLESSVLIGAFGR